MDVNFPFRPILFFGLELLAMEEDSFSDESESSSSESSRILLRLVAETIFITLLELLDDARLNSCASSSELEMLDGSDSFGPGRRGKGILMTILIEQPASS